MASESWLQQWTYILQFCGSMRFASDLIGLSVRVFGMRTLLFIAWVIYWPAAAPFSINAGLSGSWYDSETAGQGMLLDVIPSSKQMFAGWFTFLPNGDNNDGNQYWLTLQGEYSGNFAELTIYKTINGRFLTPTIVENVPVGTAQLVFLDCSHAQLSFSLTEFNAQNEINLMRATPDVYCAAHEDTNTTTTENNRPPEVAVIDVNSNEQIIDINYHLIDQENDLLDLKVFVEYAENMRYEIPQHVLNGQVGFPVLAGSDKHIYWDVQRDSGFLDLDVQIFKLILSADDRFVSGLQDIVNLVSEERIIEDIRALEGVRHQQANPAGLLSARQYILNQMSAHGVDVNEQQFGHSGQLGVNIVGDLQAMQSTDAVLIVDGHYDTVSTTPGADDNASGTAGMLEAMRVLSLFNVKKNVKFIAFDKEEQGLVGSRYFVSRFANVEQIQGVINFEMIGYTCHGQPECINFPNADVSIYNISSRFSNNLSSLFQFVGQTHVPELKITSVSDDGDPNFRRSDHAPFWDAGVDALFLTDGANFRTPHYHQGSDKLATLDTEFVANIVKTTVGTIALMAEAQHVSYAVSDEITLQ